MCYQAALAAGRRLGGDLRSAARNQRERITEQLETLDLGVTTMGEAHQRWRETVESGYDDCPAELRDAAGAIRQYNELVNVILSAAFGIAESHYGLLSLEDDLGAVRESGSPHHRQVALTLIAASVPHIGTAEPFLLAADVPADGLYVSRSAVVQFTATTDPYVDVSGQRLGALEAHPADSCVWLRGDQSD
jgi:hypothetical protein